MSDLDELFASVQSSSSLQDIIARQRNALTATDASGTVAQNASGSRKEKKRSRGDASQPTPAIAAAEAADTTADVAGEVWVCVKCTFHNNSATDPARCSMCDRKRSSRSVVLGAPQPIAAVRVAAEAAAAPEPAAAPIPEPAAATAPAPYEAAPFADPEPELESDDDLEDDYESDSSQDDSSRDLEDCEGDPERELGAKEVVELVDKLTSVEFESLPFVQPSPSAAGCNLKPFQQQGLGWMIKRETVEDACSTKGGILADAMGLGKTRMLIALIESQRKPRMRDRLYSSTIQSSATLIICPLSLLSQWVNEINQCVSPRPAILRYHGTSKKKMSIFKIASEYDYVITTYHSLLREFFPRGTTAANVTHLGVVRWFRVILDEAHFIRNQGTRLSRACANVNAERAWAVTATPIVNRLNDFFPIMRLLRVPCFSDAKFWATMSSAVTLGADERALGSLRTLLRSLMLKRGISSKVNGEPIIILPLKTTQVVTVDLTGPERDFYDAVHKNAEIKLDVFVRRRTQINAYACAFEMLMRCRQACLHPYLVVEALQRKRENGRGTQDDGLVGDQVNAQIQQFVQQLHRVIDNPEAGYAREFMDKLLTEGGGSIAENDCAICLDQLVNPAVLACCHVFCLECIRNCMASGNRRCPECRHVIDPRTGIKELPPPPQVPLGPAPDGNAPLLQDIRVEGDWHESSRVTALLSAMSQIPDDEKIIVFSHFVSFLRYIERVFESKGITSLMLHGGMTEKARNRAVQNFQKLDHHPRVLLASIQACGFGLNITRASRVFVMDPSWNPSTEEQAVNRAYRIGQTRPVIVTHFVTENTVEANIKELQEEKRKLTEMCYGARELERLSFDQIRRLFGLKENRRK